MSMGADNQAQLSASPQVRQVQQQATDAGFQTMPSLTQLGLTPRQADVLNLLLKGQPNKLIARELGLSVETIKDHVAAVLRSLGVSSRTQAVIAVSQILQKQGTGVSWRPR
jgi:DNA-binding NarL/FixJ family response regulator